MTAILVRYLALTHPPHRFAARPVPQAAIRLERLDVDHYLGLYRAVGEAYRWDQRLNMPRDALSRHLADPLCDLFVLRGEDGADPWGLCEFHSHNAETVELVNFGIVASAQGRGIGSYFLQEALTEIWHRRQPGRICLHTDEWDNPAALKIYQRAGFVIEREGYEDAANL